MLMHPFILLNLLFPGHGWWSWYVFCAIRFRNIQIASQQIMNSESKESFAPILEISEHIRKFVLFIV